MNSIDQTGVQNWYSILGSAAPIRGFGRAGQSEDSPYFSRYFSIVHSEAAADRATKSAANRRDREHQAEKRDLCELEMREFACREDAEKALSAFEEELTGSVWAQKQVLQATRFTIDKERLSGKGLLEGYKGQSKVERGFRF